MIKIFTHCITCLLVVLLTVTANCQSIQTNSDGGGSTFKVEQNYPNPTSSFTNITFSLVKDAYVTLKIFDMLGNEVIKVTDGELKSGEHTVPVDVSALETGIYFYRLSVDEHSETKKLTIRK